MVNFSDISSRAILVGLHISTWSARKFNKKATAEVNTNNGAAADAGRYNTHLLAGSKEHAAVLDAAQKARDLHYRETLPWADTGQRLLPTANVMIYTEKMRKAIRAFEAAVDDLLASYPAIKAHAPSKLGALYKDADWPSVEELPKRFSASISYDTVPTKGDARLDLPADQVEAIETSIQTRVDQSVKDAMQDAWQRLRDAVARIEKAAGDGGIVRQTLIANAQMVCDTLKRLNIAQDAELEAMRLRVETELSTIAVEDLRSDDRLRSDTERRAAAILDAMGGLYGKAAA